MRTVPSTRLLILLAIFTAFAIQYFQASNEARIFNECTGSHVTTFDALFAEFRVLDCQKEVK